MTADERISEGPKAQDGEGGTQLQRTEKCSQILIPQKYLMSTYYEPDTIVEYKQD